MIDQHKTDGGDQLERLRRRERRGVIADLGFEAGGMTRKMRALVTKVTELRLVAIDTRQRVLRGELPADQVYRSELVLQSAERALKAAASEMRERKPEVERPKATAMPPLRELMARGVRNG